MSAQSSSDALRDQAEALGLSEDEIAAQIQAMEAFERQKIGSSSLEARDVVASPSTPPAKSLKRRADEALTDIKSADLKRSPAKPKDIVDLTSDSPPKKRKKEQEPAEERRLKKHRSKAPQSFLEIKSRALTQRMFVLDRRRDTSNSDHPKETVSLAGTTGNVYTITVDKIPKCDCPHARKGNQCKHIIYVLSRVLRVPQHLEYQLAFISPELQEIFNKAPPLPSEQAKSTEKDGNRKPLEGECPICSEDFDPTNTKEEIVYCKASCGNNVHKECFQQWAATKKGGEVPCPYCRVAWQADDDELKRLTNAGHVTSEGYVNVASQLGISEKRDYSSYYQPWVSKRFGYSY